MGVFTKFGRIAAAASSVAVLSMNTVLFESPKEVQQCEAQQTKPAVVVEEKKAPVKQIVCQSKSISKAPKMAPQFDGLNFYETFIGSVQR